MPNNSVLFNTSSCGMLIITL